MNPTITQSSPCELVVGWVQQLRIDIDIIILRHLHLQFCKPANSCNSWNISIKQHISMSSSFFTIGQGAPRDGRYMAVPRWEVPLAVPWHAQWVTGCHGSMLQTSGRVPFQKWLCGEDQSQSYQHPFFSLELLSNPFQPSPEIDIPSVLGVGVQAISWNRFPPLLELRHVFRILQNRAVTLEFMTT